jgi:hypothetical protein
MQKWARDFLLLPLIVGLIVALVTFGLPRILGDKLELSYEIDGPTRYLSDPAVRSMEVSVNGTPVEDIVSYRVKIWNSGGSPIRGLPVRIVLKGEESEISILAVSHNTTPAYEFGEILPLESASNSRRFKYELLNDGDQDIVTLIADVAVPVDVYAKAEGLKLVRVDPEQALTIDELIQGPAIAIVSAIAALLTLLLQRFTTFQEEIEKALRRTALRRRKDKHSGD